MNPPGPFPGPLIKRLLAVGVAFVVAWVVYMIAMMMTVYDGLPSLILQPILGAIASGLVVGLALILGLLIRIPFVGKLWRRTPWGAALLTAGSAGLLCFGYALGLRETFTNPETGRSFQSLHSGAALGGYFALIFSLANWPFREAAASRP
jgi:hypothetical protein